MLEQILAPVIQWTTNVISAGGYPAVALLMAIESAAIPLPSEIIMPFSGYLVSLGRFTLLGAALAGGIGSVLGSWIIYFIALKGGRPLIKKYGHYVFISEGDLEKTDKFFRKHGLWSTFIGRMLPVVRTYISIPAGIAKTPFWPFTIAAFVGSFIWSYFLAYLGKIAGEHWDTWHEKLKGLDYFIAGIILLALVWYIVHHIVDRKRQRS